MELITMANRRGGCGKSVTALTMGAGLQKRGYSVLFVDMDSQYNLTLDMAAAGAGRYDSMDVLTGKASALEAIIKTPQGDLIPATPALSGADVIITQTGKEYRLKEALERLDYDYCIIDTAPALDITTVNALTAADGVIVPTHPEIHGMDGINLLNDSLQTVKKYCNPGLEIYGILLTRYNPRSIICRDMRDNLQAQADRLDTILYTTPIRQCTAIPEAQAMRINILDYAPRSNAAKDYTAFIDEFLTKKGIRNDG